MKIPRDLSGQVLAETLCRRWGYERVHQTASHIILQTAEPTKHRIAIPAHPAIRLGTLNSILRSVADHKGTSREALIHSLWLFTALDAEASREKVDVQIHDSLHIGIRIDDEAISCRSLLSLAVRGAPF